MVYVTLSEIKHRLKKYKNIDLYHKNKKDYDKIFSIKYLPNTKEYSITCHQNNPSEYLSYFLKKSDNLFDSNNTYKTKLSDLWNTLSFRKKFYCEEEYTILNKNTKVESKTFDEVKSYFPFKKVTDFDGTIMDFKSPTEDQVINIITETLDSLNIFYIIKKKTYKKYIDFKYLGESFYIEIFEDNIQIDPYDDDYGFHFWFVAKIRMKETSSEIKREKFYLRPEDINSPEDILKYLLLVNKSQKIDPFSLEMENTFSKTKWCIPEYFRKDDNRYYADRVFESEKDKNDYISKGIKTISMYPNFKEATEKALSRLSYFRQTLLSYGYKEIIVQYFERLEVYVHPNPRKYSSFNAWRFKDPIVWDIEKNTLQLKHLPNNEKLNLPELNFCFDDNDIFCGCITTMITNENRILDRILKDSFPNFGLILKTKGLK